MLLEPPDSAQTIVDPKNAAEFVGLRYVSDDRPGIRRRKAGSGFTYTRVDGSLAVPPAWTDVWICPFSDGHISRDAEHFVNP